MQSYINPPREVWAEIQRRPLIQADELRTKVKTILDAIKTEGFTAVQRFARQFDGRIPTNIEVSKEEISAAAGKIDEKLKQALKTAAQNISRFHSSQLKDYPRVTTSEGVVCWQKAVPIEKVGLYIPGGSAPLFSTVLMLGIPAKLAGCREIILCTPCNQQDEVNPAILFAADLVGITRIFKLGGAQAIGAMAYGAGPVPAVFKLFGPGNQYVMAAKQQVSIDQVAIDMPAGPSEVAVMADETANPAFIASDLLSQAEHGPDSQVILVTTSRELPEKVNQELALQLNLLPRKEIACQALGNSKMIIMETSQDLIDFINQYAPEHLIIAMKDYTEIAEKIHNAGSVFLGNYTPESAGDYASGTNHTLPTNGWARSYSGVNMDSFLRKITFQKITAEGLIHLGPVIEEMAAAEQLTAHKNAVSLRLKSIQNNQ